MITYGQLDGLLLLVGPAGLARAGRGRADPVSDLVRLGGRDTLERREGVSGDQPRVLAIAAPEEVPVEGWEVAGEAHVVLLDGSGLVVGEAIFGLGPLLGEAHDLGDCPTEVGVALVLGRHRLSEDFEGLAGRPRRCLVLDGAHRRVDAPLVTSMHWCIPLVHGCLLGARDLVLVRDALANEGIPGVLVGVGGGGGGKLAGKGSGVGDASTGRQSGGARVGRSPRCSPG